MIKFVNAKINLGLNIVRKREDGYHDLETVFFPVGIESGMPQQPEAFDDILEVNTDSNQLSGCRFQLMGRRIDCAPEKNLVVKAATLFIQTYVKKYDDLSDMECSTSYSTSICRMEPDLAAEVRMPHSRS